MRACAPHALRSNRSRGATSRDGRARQGTRPRPETDSDALVSTPVLLARYCSSLLGSGVPATHGALDGLNPKKPPLSLNCSMVPVRKASAAGKKRYGPVAVVGMLTSLPPAAVAIEAPHVTREIQTRLTVLVHHVAALVASKRDAPGVARGGSGDRNSPGNC